jgi:hypothetical protein
MFFLFRRHHLHYFRARERSLHFLNLCNEYFERIDRQSFGWFDCL